MFSSRRTYFFCYAVNILDTPSRHHCKVTLLTLCKMVIWRTLVWLCMIFMVWPMRMGLLGLRQGVWGGQRIISVGCLENNKALEAREGVSTWLDHRDPRDGRNGFVRLENAQCGQEARGSTSAE